MPSRAQRAKNGYYKIQNCTIASVKATQHVTAVVDNVNYLVMNGVAEWLCSSGMPQKLEIGVIAYFLRC